MKTKILIVILALALIATVYYFFFYPRLNMDEVKKHVADFAANAENKDQIVSLEYLLLQGVKELRWNRASYQQVVTDAKASGTTIEHAIVDAAIKQARAFGYIN